MAESQIDQPAEGLPAKPVVLFDGACPMCRREIAHYRRIRGARRLLWVDIDRTPDLEQRFGVARDAALARFHVRDCRGHWQTGAHGFVEVWRHLAGYRWLGRVVSGLRLTGPLDRAYRLWAGWRLARRCDSGTCRGLPSGSTAGSADITGDR
jgi:predicted DCC family thiol-disulfide oxidoreductase YuxK